MSALKVDPDALRPNGSRGRASSVDTVIDDVICAINQHAVMLDSGGTVGPAGPQGPQGEQWAQGPQGNTGATGAAGTSVTISTTMLDLAYASREHRVTIADALASLSSMVVAQVVGSDADANDPSMDAIRVTATPGDASITFVVVCDQPIGGPLKILYQVG